VLTKSGFPAVLHQKTGLDRANGTQFRKSQCSDRRPRRGRSQPGPALPTSSHGSRPLAQRLGQKDLGQSPTGPKRPPRATPHSGSWRDSSSRWEGV